MARILPKLPSDVMLMTSKQDALSAVCTTVWCRIGGYECCGNRLDYRHISNASLYRMPTLLGHVHSAFHGDSLELLGV